MSRLRFLVFKQMTILYHDWAAPIPNGIKDWIGYMQFVEPFEADTLSSTDRGVLRGDTNICIVLNRYESRTRNHAGC